MRILLRRGPADGQVFQVSADFLAVRGDVFIVMVNLEKVYYKFCGRLDEETYVYTPDGYL